MMDSIISRWKRYIVFTEDDGLMSGDEDDGKMLGYEEELSCLKMILRFTIELLHHSICKETYNSVEVTLYPKL